MICRVRERCACPLRSFLEGHSLQINAQVLDEDIIQNMIKLYQSPQQTRIAKAWNAIR